MILFVLSACLLFGIIVAVNVAPGPLSAAKATAVAENVAAATRAAVPFGDIHQVPVTYKIASYAQLVKIKHHVYSLGIESALDLSAVKLMDSGWVSQRLAHANSIGNAEKALLKVTPPEQAEMLHARILNIAGTCAAAADALTIYIETQSGTELSRVVRQLHACKRDLPQTLLWVKEGAPSPTPHFTPTPRAATASTALGRATVTQSANLRSGPGTGYAVVAVVEAGTPVLIRGRNVTGDWYQLDNGKWIAAFLVEGAPDDLTIVSEE